MKQALLLLLSLITASHHAISQNTFKAGWYTYTTGMIVHEYTYAYTFPDSLHLYLADSATTYISTDSMVAMRVESTMRNKSVMKTVTYLNDKKKVAKTEAYKGDELIEVNEWKYDDKNRKIYHTEDIRSNNDKYKLNYDYATDKKTGETVITESEYVNGKIRFYTKSYYDKNSVKVKEVRLNDNNKDVIHIENYTYGENGKVKERSVYFPEFRVTKKFPESEGSQLPKCFKTVLPGIADKPTVQTKVAYIKKIASKNRVLLQDAECQEFEYKFMSGLNCDVTFCTTKVNNQKQAVFRIKEKL